MRFVGILAIDEGGNKLNSFNTKPMTYGDSADWYIKAVEYVRTQCDVTLSIKEARVMIYDAATVNSLRCEPIDGVMFRRTPKGEIRELKILPMSS